MALIDAKFPEEEVHASKNRLLAGAAVTSLALVVTACGGGGSTTPDSGTSTGASGGGDIVVNGCTPKAALIAGNTSETCGGNIIDAFAAKLVHYNSDTAARRWTWPTRSTRATTRTSR